MLIGRHFEGSDLTSAATAAAGMDLGVFQCTIGRISDPAPIRRLTANTISVVRGSTVPNLTCFERGTLLHARTYTAELLRWAEKLGFCAVIMEAGAAPDSRVDVRRRLVASVRAILHDYQGGTQLLIENGSGAGSLTNIGHCLGMVDDERLGVSLHLGDAYARGYEVYDLTTLVVPRVGVVQLTVPDANVECGGGSFRYGVVGESAWSMREISDLVLAHRNAPIVVTGKTAQDADIVRQLAHRDDDTVWLDSDFPVEHR